MAGRPKTRARRAAQAAALLLAPPVTVDEQGNVEGEADGDGEIRAEDLVSRLQKHATGNPCMDSTQVTAATRLLDYVARQPSNASDIPIAKPVMPSDVGDDDALAAYLAMIG